METGLSELKELFELKDRDLRTYSPLTLAAVMLSTFFRFLIINLLLNLCKSVCHLASHGAQGISEKHGMQIAGMILGTGSATLR